MIENLGSKQIKYKSSLDPSIYNMKELIEKSYKDEYLFQNLSDILLSRLDI